MSREISRASTVSVESRLDSGAVKRCVELNSSECQLEILDPLGSGAYGEVYRAALYYKKPDGSEGCYIGAAKVLLDDTASDQCPYEFELHGELTSDIQSSASAGLLRSITVMRAKLPDGSEKLCHFMSLGKMDLESCIAPIVQLKNTNPLLYQEIVHRFFSSMITALKIMNQKNVVHFDLKPKNILLLGSGYFCVTDFGCASKTENASEVELKGTVGYIAPEVIAEEPIIPAEIDVFSIGIILKQLLGMEIRLPSGNRESAQTRFLYKEAMAYVERKSENTLNSEALSKHHAEVREGILSTTNFNQCLMVIAEHMTQTIQEERITIETLECVFDHLASLKANSISNSEIKKFYLSVIEESMRSLSQSSVYIPSMARDPSASTHTARSSSPASNGLYSKQNSTSLAQPEGSVNTSSFASSAGH